MCSSPIRIKNRARSMYVGCKAYVTVPCGHCADCNKSAVSEMHTRAYMESLDCLESDGFMWFDTLTYDDDNLPHIDDFDDSCLLPLHDNFSCFNNDHLTLALKRLRRSWSHKIRMFIVPEYGNDDRFTHRPHYHCLFYVYGGKPQDFGVLLQRSWSYGFTDYCNPFNNQPLSHFLINKSANAQRVVGYISKYISKIYSFLEVVRNRLDFVKDVCPTLYRKIMPRRRLSIGFGLSAIIRHADEVLTKDTISYNEGIMPVCFKLNKYYVRSLYQYLTKDDLGHRRWIFKAVASPYLMRKADNDINDRVDKYKDLITSSYISKLESEFFNALLYGRSLYDLATYDLYFRDRLFTSEDIDCNSLSRLVCSEAFAKMATVSQSRVFHVPDGDFGLSECYLLTDVACTYSDAIHTLYDKDISNIHVDKVELGNLNIITDNYLYEWRNFDALIGLLHTIALRSSKFNDKAEHFCANNINKLKSLKR